jgi:hypothetical protein
MLEDDLRQSNIGLITASDDDDDDDGDDELVPVSTGVNGSAQLNRASLIELRRVINAPI